MSFENLNLHPLILKAINDAGYTSPTPIQEQAIPALLAATISWPPPRRHRQNCRLHAAGAAPSRRALQRTRPRTTGTGADADAGTRAPGIGSRGQVWQTSPAHQSREHTWRHALSAAEQTAFATGDILVATPGRLIDHIQRGRIEFSRLEMMVLDEADRMLDMGFIDDVETIASATPATRQTLLFSATLDGAIDKVAARLLKLPQRIQVAAQQARLDNIEQRLHYVDDMSHKNRLLDHLLRDIAMKQAIVFTATKRDADTLADNLSAQGHEAAALHGDMNQRDRTRTLTKLRHGGLRVLVATDVAARGIDVAGITHVINFDLPKFAEDYVHRIGRTGRAGASGIAVSFASVKDGVNLKKIERFTGQRIDSHVVPGLEPRFKPRPGVGAGAGARPEARPASPTSATVPGQTIAGERPRSAMETGRMAAAVPLAIIGKRRRGQTPQPILSETAARRAPISGPSKH